MLLAVAGVRADQRPARAVYRQRRFDEPSIWNGQQIVEITVDRWSPNAERERLVTALQTKGIRRAAEATAEEQAGRPHPDARLAWIRPSLRAADAAS